MRKRTLLTVATLATLAVSGTAVAEAPSPAKRSRVAAPTVHIAAAARRPGTWLTGSYESTYGVVELRQRGDQITGKYVCCGGGTIRGTITGRVVLYEWNQTGASGRGVWVVRGDRLVGTWGSGTSEDNGGVWSLYPSPPPTKQAIRRRAP